MGIETYGWCTAGEEDQGPQVGGTLVAQGTSGIDQGSDTVALDGRTDEGRAPGRGGRGSFLGLEELLLGVGGLGAVVGVTKERRKDSEGGSMVEDGAEGDGRRLDRWEIWMIVSWSFFHNGHVMVLCGASGSGDRRAVEAYIEE